jgi:hypothetical protein
VAGVDWGRIRFTEHMTEAAAVVAECQVVLDFEGGTPVTYAIKVFETLKGAAQERYFAVGTSREDMVFRPLGSGEDPEEALQACLNNAGIHHRRLLKQARDK